MQIDLVGPKDYWGNDATSLKGKRLFLFDMDGTIYEEDNLFDGTVELLRAIEDIKGRYVFISNNSSKSVLDYVSKVNRLGIKAKKENFFTSTQATIVHLKKRYPDGKIYCQGTKSFVKELRDASIYVTEEVEKDVEVVLVGFDTELTSSKLRKTCELLQKDIPFIATNADLRCPVDFGFIPDCGSICRMIEMATDKKPIYMGKPDPIMVDLVRKEYGYLPEETVVIGDRLYTDIAVGLNAGVTSICVLTGETTPDDIKNGDIKPDYTFSSVKDIWKILDQIRISKDGRA